MGKKTVSMWPMLLLFVVIAGIAIFMWAFSEPDTSVPPTALQEALFAFLCLGGAVAGSLGLVFAYLSSCYNSGL